MKNNESKPESNIEKVRKWKGRLAALGLKNADMMAKFKKSVVTISRWLNPDTYGITASAEDIDRVEAWLEWHESRQAKKGR